MKVLSVHALLVSRSGRGPRGSAARLHMKNGRQFVVFLIALLLLTGIGCQKKQPQIPSQAKAPAEPIPTPLPPEIAQETPAPPAPQPSPQPVKAEEPKPQPPKHRKKKPSQTQTTAAQSGDTTAVSSNSPMAAAHPPANPANEAPPDTAIAADVSSAQLLQQKQTTAQLVDATEKTLNGLPH